MGRYRYHLAQNQSLCWIGPMPDATYTINFQPEVGQE
jgi:hypothetical protein